MNADRQSPPHVDLKSLCRLAGDKADHLQPAAARAREDAASAVRGRRWRVGMVAAAALVGAAVMAARYVGDDAGSSVAAHVDSPSAGSPQAQALPPPPAPTRPLPASPERVVRAVTAPPDAIATPTAPGSEPAREPETQAEKELRESQPDGSC